MFHFMFFTFLLLVVSMVTYFFSNKLYAADLLEQAFEPAMTNETIVNLWAGKNAVGNEILRQWAGAQLDIGAWCDINWTRSATYIITAQKNAAGFGGTESAFCTDVLWWTWDSSSISMSGTTQAPLIVRIAKFLLRITMVLSVTMVIFNGIMWILESSKWSEVKDAKKNITLIIAWILISLMSLGIINLISSITVSSLSTESSNASSCVINGNVLSGEPLKKYICENSFYGKWYPDRIGNWCRVDYYRNNPWWSFDAGHRAGITDTEMVSKCIELGWEYKN